MNAEYDVVIIGGGPAGLTAGLYTSRARLNSLLIERGLVGGQIVNAESVENYPGFAEGIGGLELGQLMYQQATKYGLQTLLAEATDIELQQERKLVKTTEGDFVAKAVIVTSGSERSKLDVLGEDEFVGKGVSYCATCDATFFGGRSVAVVGGGDAAITEALHLTRFASQVTVIHRRNQLRATRILQEKAFSEPKIKFLWDSVVDKIEGEEVVNTVRSHADSSAFPVFAVSRRRGRGTPRPRVRAFTLLEMLTVMTIIALLMSLLVPALQAARTAAKTLHCSSNI